jgi:signal transduction histidine kinase/DNA-binding response OmpR family regulator
MREAPTIRVLIVEDDEEDFFLTSELLKDIRSVNFCIERAGTFEAGFLAMAANSQEICLVDFRLNGHDGIELLQAARAAGAEAPVILLTGAGGEEADHAAMKAGAADYLVKGQVEAAQLERAIRYAIERKRAASVAAFEQARLAAFGAQVGLVVTQRAPLPVILEKCATAMLQYLSASLAQVLTYDAAKDVFELRASVGRTPHPAMAEAQKLDLPGLREGRPVFVASFAKATPSLEQMWLEEEGFGSYAIYPLVLEERLVGCLALYSETALPDTLLQELGSVSNGVALCIQSKLVEAQVEKLAAFPRVNPNPILELTAEAEISYANDAATALARSLGKTQILEVLPAGVRAIVAECFQKNTKRMGELVVVGSRTISWSFFPVLESSVVHCYGSEITEMLNLEAQYRHSQKLESVGQMAAGIAHDYNNIITVVQGYADCLLRQVNGDATLASPLKQISAAASRAATLTRKLLAFSRKQVIQTRPLDVNAVLVDLGKMLPRLLGETITLETHYGGKLPAVEADAGMLEQVIMNLAVNARDAMPAGGRLTILTSAPEIDEHYVRRHPEARVGRFVSIMVKDTGCGMDVKTLARIFEPFFSTKEVGRGTGLGLATVYGIVKQHQGWVEVTSAVGTGTTFRVLFPALKTAMVATDDQTESILMARGGRETILLVEDEPELREMVATILKGFQYRVLEAETGVQALKVWDEHHGKVDLLLTDMVMPGGIGGAELAQQLRGRKADLRVIYTSGYSSEIVGHNLSQNDAIFLPKPYRPPQLALRVRKSLDAPPMPILEPATATA